MIFQLFLLHFILLLFQPASSSLIISKPGCLSVCGNVSIPYPFGVGSNCSLDPSFDIKCDASTNPPKPYLSISHEAKEVIEINKTYIRVKYPNLVSVCYDLSEYRHGNATTVAADTHTLLNLTGTRYTLSEENQIIAIGCDDMVLATTQSDGSWVTGGCSAFCADENDAGGGGVGYCGAGYSNSINNGCCQAAISGETEIDTVTGFTGVQFVDLAGMLPRRKLFSCSHATIREVSNMSEIAFSYPLYYLNNSTALLNDNQLPIPGFSVVRLGWVVGAENCSTTEFDSSAYACQDSKSVCIDTADDYRIRSGYLCSCGEGYEGNPYLPGGCKPISSPISSARSGCLEQCGELSIPFPFGVGPNCYLEPSFEIVCNTTTNPPTAFLHVLNLEIIELDSTKVLVRKQANLNSTSNCYNLLNGDIESKNGSLIIDLSQTQYTFSDDNVITAIGCNGMVVMVTGKGNQSSIRSSCSPVCSDNQLRAGSTNAKCGFGAIFSSPDDGCCKASIPRGTNYLEANFTDLSGLWTPANISCSYAFPRYVEYSTESYGYIAYPFLDNEMTLDGLLSYVSWDELAFDWRIGAVNCKEARLDQASFACQSNSDCIDYNSTVELGGYLCNCSQGFQGNPYTNQGCQDIDECTTNPCDDSNAICINTPGSFRCSCPKGYYAHKSANGRESCIPSKSMINVFIGLGSGLGFILLLTICMLLHMALRKRRNRLRREKFFKRNGGLLLRQQSNEGTIQKTKLFAAEELQKATDNFNESRILGQGGQGTVYKGMLSDGKIVAIKKSKIVGESQLNQFINEVVILSHINHKNIIKLWGSCLETEVPLLVYECLPNGTLYDLIHESNNEPLFPWKMRLKMSVDIAGALTYLHTSSSIPVYHRDIKSSNFLLDEKHVVKVADFGISKFVAEDQTHLTTMVKGTFGYFDPEYFHSRQYTDKSDVFSFGVVLAELLTGKKPIIKEASEETEMSLSTYFLTSMEENNLEVVLDPIVAKHNRKEGVIAVARLAQRCLNWERKMRPTMKEVCTELESLWMSEMPRTVEDEANDIRVYDHNHTMISDIEYARTATTCISKSSTSSSDTHPFMIENV